MEKLITIPEDGYATDVITEDNYSRQMPDGSYPKTIRVLIPRHLIQQINKLILNQNNLIDANLKLEKILQSNLGKAMLGLEPEYDQEEKKI